MKEMRRRKIEELVNARQTVSMQELCDTFGVSINTIRADVASLVQAGVIEKIYGGVSAKIQPKAVALFTVRTGQFVAEKRAIARRAAALIQEGDVVFLDAGTTTMYILPEVSPELSFTLVTHSIPIVMQAMELPNVKLIVLPGLHNRRTNALLDGSTPEYLSRYQLTKAFMGVSALAANGTLGVSSYPEYLMKQTAIQRSQKRYLLTDSSKLGESGLLSYGTVEQMDQILTDRAMAPEFIALCREKGVSIERV